MRRARRRATTTISGRWSTRHHARPGTGSGACRCTRITGSFCAARSQTSRTGGHLSPNLGVVELTFALHRVFDSPKDAIVWDTGHQAYVHKLVTGRAGEFARLRQAGGLSGYPSRKESEHDLVENSHASTSLSYALGLAEARPRKHVGGFVVAVIGDGALTGGRAYEALNQIAHLQP